MAAFKVIRKFWIPPAALAASAPFFLPRLFAEESKEQHSKLIKASELPIYSKDEKHQHEHIEEYISPLRQYVSQARQGIWGVINSAQQTKDSITDVIETGKSHTRESVEYLRNEANIVPRAAFIAGGALTGLLLSIRRGFFKKLIYSSTGIAVTASICYPKQSKRIAQAGYAYVKHETQELYDKLTGEKSAAASPSNIVTDPKRHEIPKGFYDNFTKKYYDTSFHLWLLEFEVEAAGTENLMKIPGLSSLPITHHHNPEKSSQKGTTFRKSVFDPKTMDKGMSLDEDQDMYTTRSQT